VPDVVEHASLRKEQQPSAEDYCVTLLEAQFCSRNVSQFQIYLLPPSLRQQEKMQFPMSAATTTLKHPFAKLR